MTVAPRLTHGHERYLVMIEKLVEIHAGLPFAGAQLSLSHRHAEQRQRYIVNGWADPFFKTRVDRRERKASRRNADIRSEEHTSEIQSLMRISYAVFCLKKNKKPKIAKQTNEHYTTNNRNNNHHQ